MKNHEDRRCEPRTLHDTPITTKVITSTSPSIAVGHTFESSCRDISQNGLCLRVNTAVHPGTELEMWIISSHHKESLLVSGQVRWCLPVKMDPSLHQIGVELKQDGSGDYAQWRQMVADLAPKL